jgi:hypothetical protein
VACSGPQDLASQLERDARDPAGSVAAWRLSRSTWDRVVVVPFRELYDAYAAEYPAHLGRNAEGLTHLARPIAPRPHFAGDPKLTLDEAVTRWIVPTMFPSQVVDGLDAVFVEEDHRFYAFTGIAEVIAKQLPPPCRPLLARVGPPGRCGDAMWQHVVDTLRRNPAAAEHSCRLAQALCGTGSP